MKTYLIVSTAFSALVFIAALALAPYKAPDGFWIEMPQQGDK